jgi:hypothetical protein
MAPVEDIGVPDPVVEAYKRHVDRTLFDRTLRLTPTERIQQLQQFVAFLAGIEDAGRRRLGHSGDHQTS